MKRKTRNSNNSKQVLKPKWLQSQRFVLLILAGAWISVSGQQREQKGGQKEAEEKDRKRPPSKPKTPRGKASAPLTPPHNFNVFPSLLTRNLPRTRPSSRDCHLGAWWRMLCRILPHLRRTARMARREFKKSAKTSWTHHFIFFFFCAHTEKSRNTNVGKEDT